jgi:hypothetical protein
VQEGVHIGAVLTGGIAGGPPGGCVQRAATQPLLQCPNSSHMSHVLASSKAPPNAGTCITMRRRVVALSQSLLSPRHRMMHSCCAIFWLTMG